MKLTLLGAGVRVPFVLRGLAERRDLGLTEVVLHDIDQDRLELMGALGAHLTTTWGAPYDVRADPDLRAAIAGASFVYSAVRPGQEAARVVDEEVPLALGVLGQETTGPGGFAMAMRTVPAMLAHARAIEEVAPDALLICFTNPVGIVTQAVRDHTSVRVVGICDGPSSMHRSVAAFLGRPREQVHVDYAGLNHCGWIHRVLVDGRDRLPELLDRYEELASADHQWRLFDPTLVRRIGMLPMEYLSFFYEPERTVANIRASGESRAIQLQALNDALWRSLRERIEAGDMPGAVAAWERAIAERGATYFARELGEGRGADTDDVFDDEGYQGVAGAVMTAAVHDRPATLILDTVNRGAIATLGDDDVVEVTSVSDRHGAHALAQGELPAHATDLLERVKAYERLTVEAAVTGSAAAARDALTQHPLVARADLASQLVDRYVEAYAGLWPALS